MKRMLLLLFAVIGATATGYSQKSGDVNCSSLQSQKTGEHFYIPPPSSFSDGIRSATFDITFNTYTTDAQTAFQFAADIWGSILVSDVPIKINTYFTPLLPGLLGITLPNGRKDFSTWSVPATWYASSLANAITGNELNPGEYDIDLFLNSSVAWYFGTDGNCPGNKYDFVSIVLHEICHGLGFVGLGKVENNIGSFGLLEASDFAPIVTSFPWPDLDTLPGIYDTYLEETNFSNLTFFPNPSEELADQFTGNQVFFGGLNAYLFNGGTRPKIYAPAAFSLGSSLLHLDESTYPAGSINELMTPFSGTADAIHDPGPITIGILMDIGWMINYNVGISQVNSNQPDLVLYPDPAHEFINVSGIEFRNGIFYTISDFMGKEVMTGNTSQIDVSSLIPGIYFLSIKDGKYYLANKFIKD